MSQGHFTIRFSTPRAPKSKPMPTTHEMAALATTPSDCVKPATANVRNDTAATVRA